MRIHRQKRTDKQYILPDSDERYPLRNRVLYVCGHSCVFHGELDRPINPADIQSRNCILLQPYSPGFFDPATTVLCHDVRLDWRYLCVYRLRQRLHRHTELVRVYAETSALGRPSETNTRGVRSHPARKLQTGVAPLQSARAVQLGLSLPPLPENRPDCKNIVPALLCERRVSGLQRTASPTPTESGGRATAGCQASYFVGLDATDFAIAQPGEHAHNGSESCTLRRYPVLERYPGTPRYRTGRKRVREHDGRHRVSVDEGLCAYIEYVPLHIFDRAGHIADGRPACVRNRRGNTARHRRELESGVEHRGGCD